MNINGLWSISFWGPYGSTGTGIIVFCDGKIYGGDPAYFYTGTYSLNNNELKAAAHIKHYQGAPDNIFGPVSQIDLVFEGAVSNQFIMGYGFEPRNPGQRMSFKMQRLQNMETRV